MSHSYGRLDGRSPTSILYHLLMELSRINSMLQINRRYRLETVIDWSLCLCSLYALTPLSAVRDLPITLKSCETVIENLRSSWWYGRYGLPFNFYASLSCCSTNYLAFDSRGSIIVTLNLSRTKRLRGRQTHRSGSNEMFNPFLIYSNAYCSTGYKTLDMLSIGRN